MNPPPTNHLPPLKPAPGAVARRKSRVCTREACENCREKKAKCNGKNPCPRCASRGLECRYEERTYQTKRSLRAELWDLRDGQRRRDAVIAALATPAQADRILRRLWDGSTVAEIYDMISGEDAGSESPTAVGTPAATDEDAEPEATERMRSTSISQAGSIPPGNGSFGPEELAAADHGQLGYGMSPFASGPFTSPPLQSFDASIMNGQIFLASGEYEQAMDHQYSSVDPGTAKWWACGGGTPAFSSFSGTSSANSMPWMGWQFPAAAGNVEPSCSYSIPSATPSSIPSAILSPPAPHSSAPSSLPSREPVRSSAASASVSSPPKGQSPPENETPDPADLPAASADEHAPGRPRPQSPHPEETPPTRDRHRQASARNWQRRKRQFSDLQDAKAEAEARNRELRRQHSQALAEVLAAKEALMGHAGCGHPGIGGWLQTQATKFVTGGGDGAVAARGRVPGSLSSASAAVGREGAACRS
ncbi:fungal specific transcription factor domain-containing protein [Colletotrichum plurivorum]|uniref:Fungal specific transcription factor domain-containing protein n=1 Tax=Colletotrichum plurivorum TaxID=2175906 RepID=A0A8H6NF64_9PEZI|nr:fungal specific transcription factor domain-containing protein [Colletotrichum plurivorum]